MVWKTACGLKRSVGGAVRSTLTNSESHAIASVRLVTNGGRRVVDLDIAGWLAFGSCACGAAGLRQRGGSCRGGSCRGHRCGGEGDCCSARSQQGCDVCSAEAHDRFSVHGWAL